MLVNNYRLIRECEPAEEAQQINIIQLNSSILLKYVIVIK